jgi:hypothetical protein
MLEANYFRDSPNSIRRTVYILVGKRGKRNNQFIAAFHMA